jgi:hypothetical protein
LSKPTVLAASALVCLLLSARSAAADPADQPPPPAGSTNPATTTAIPNPDSMAVMTMTTEDHHAHHHHAPGQLGAYPGSRDSSGTAWQPDSAAHDGLHLPIGAWTVMIHGEATLVYDGQSGPRGGYKTFVQSHLAVDADRLLLGGTFTLRTLVSLDPLMGANGYPLLFQTGETANGVTPLIDRQHPHNLIGELAAAYSHPVTDHFSVFVYGGPAGEPALGPPVYLHRATGQADPEAPIDHHWLDSTHLAWGVATVGVVLGDWKLESSTFTGREPDQNRYDIGPSRFDSWSARATWNPAPNWSIEVSRGFLRSPEQLLPHDNQTRTIASAIYNRPFNWGNWQTVFAWGRMQESAPVTRTVTSDAYLLESTVGRGPDTVFGRVENVSKDDLFAEGQPGFGVLYNVTKASLGYQRAFLLPHHLAADVGAVVSKYDFPQILDTAYGANPTSFMLFTRIRLRS